jgi:2-succinyl-6-hydroxy-2,4-cyclohexadiene-1-carboxylate synthase
MLSYSLVGPAHQPCLVFLHGFLGCKEDWEPVINHLGPSFRCLSIDLPAHGQSPYSDDLFASILTSLDSLHIHQPVLVGYSMGGRIALLLSQQHSAFFSGAVILSAHIGLNSEIEKQEQKKREEQWSALLLNAPSSEFLQKWYDQPFFSSLKKKTELYASILEKRKYHNAHALDQVFKAMSLSKQPSIQTFSIPTYFLYGEEDRKYEALYSTLPKSTKKDKILDSGHAVHLENSEDCATKIKQWLIEEIRWK